MICRRDLFKGVGAFLGAATAYKTSEAGVFLPFDKIITESVPPWAGKTMITAFEGEVSSFHLNANIDHPIMGSLDGKMIGFPIVSTYDFGMDFYHNNIPSTSILTSRIYVQIFQKMD